MNTIENNGFSDENIFETFLTTGRVDTQGRQIGWIVGFNDNGTDFRAWVQAARQTGEDFADFGTRQRSKSFNSQKSARDWAYSEAKRRISEFLAK